MLLLLIVVAAAAAAAVCVLVVAAAAAAACRFERIIASSSSESFCIKGVRYAKTCQCCIAGASPHTLLPGCCWPTLGSTMMMLHSR